MPYRTFRNKLKRIVLHHILHVDDSPERIAFGAAIGMFIAWTPTVGAQMIIAVTLAALLRANKAVTLPLVWITNPITVMPIYLFNYKFGLALLTGSWSPAPEVKANLERLTQQTIKMNIFSHSYWRDFSRLVVDISWPLWVGSVTIGVIAGLATYLGTRRMIKRHRLKVERRRGAAAGREQPTMTAKD